MLEKRNPIPTENTHDLLVGTLSIGIPSFNLKILIGSSWAWPGDQKQNFLPHCMKQIIYIYVIHHATNQLCNKQNINLELSRFSIRSVFAGKLSDGIWLKKFLDNMSQDAKDVVPGELSPLKPADAEVQKICDQVSVY